MDFHGMKRKRLQALCKKHGIPANLKSCVMADRLSLLFKEKEMEYPVGSGYARTEKDTTLHCVVCKNVEMIDLVTPSPGSKERSVFSSKNLKGSEIERLEFETNFSPEITREDFGICGVGNMQSRLKKEHDNSQGGLHLAPVAVALVEFNNQMSEGEDEKLGDNNNLIGDMCEFEKGKTEAEEHGVHNSLRGSNMKDMNALHSSKEEYGSPMKVEDEATEQGDCNSPQGSRMKDVKVLYVSQEESGYPVMEKDEAVEQGDKSSSPGSNMKDVNALHASVEESGSPMMEEGATIDKGNCISSQGSSMKKVHIFHVSQEESGYPVMEKDEAEEQGDHNSPPGSNTKDVTVLHASEEECSFPTMVEEDNALKQGPSMKDVNILLLSQKVSDYPIAEDVAVEQGDNNSPQGPNIKDVNILHVYQEESLYPVVEEDVAVEQGDHNSPQGPNIKDVNILDVYQEESLYPVVEEDVVVEQGDHISPQVPNIKDMNILHDYQEEDAAVEQGDNNSPQGPNIKDVNTLHVYQEESVYPAVEEDASVEQGDHNNPQGPNIKDVNILHVYQEESVYPAVEEDVAVEQGGHNSPQGPNIKDVNILHVYQEESLYLVVEEDAAVEQGDHNSPQGPNIKDVNILHVYQEESLSPVVEEDAAVEQGDHSSPQGPNIKDVNILHVYQEESLYPVVEEDAAVEQGDHNSPQGPNIKDVNILHVYQEESVYPVVEEDVAVQQGDQNISQGPNMKEVNVLHDCLEESGYPMVEEEEVVEQGDHNSPQGSNLKDVSVMHVSQEDFGFPTVEEVQKAEGNICNGSVYDLLNTGSEVDAKNTDGKINLTAEHSVDDGPSSLSKSSVGTHDQFQSSYPENEVVSSGLNIYQDTCKEELKSPQNTGPIANPGECSRFSPHNLEASLVESFQFETYSDPSPLGDIGTCNLKESMQSYKIEKVEYKTKVTIEQFTDELQSSTFEDSDGTPVQFLSNDALSEVKTDFNVHEMVVSGIVFENVDMSEAKFVSSRKISLRPASDRMIDFSPKQLNNSETKVLQSETKLFPETADVGIGEMENMQMDVNKELVDEVGDYLLEGEIDKSGLIADSEEVDNVICDVEENMQIIVNEKQVEESEQVIRATPSPMLLNNVEVGEQLLEGEIEKSGLKADSEECIGILPNNLLPSATKGFEDETYFDQSALGDVVETFKMEESMPSDQMEKEFSQKVQHMANDSVQEEITRLINNSDDHEYVGVTGPEDGKNQHNMKRDMESIEKYLLNDFHTLEDENAPTMPQEGEMKLCSFNHQQMSASGTFCGDEMETPPKCTNPKLRESFIKKELKNLSSLPVKRARDILGASDMKENIKTSKKTPSRSAFPKRKPLQHLQQN